MKKQKSLGVIKMPVNQNLNNKNEVCITTSISKFDSNNLPKIKDNVNSNINNNLIAKSTKLIESIRSEIKNEKSVQEEYSDIMSKLNINISGINSKKDCSNLPSSTDVSNIKKELNEKNNKKHMNIVTNKVKINSDSNFLESLIINKKEINSTVNKIKDELKTFIPCLKENNNFNLLRSELLRTKMNLLLMETKYKAYETLLHTTKIYLEKDELSIEKLKHLYFQHSYLFIQNQKKQAAEQTKDNYSINQITNLENEIFNAITDIKKYLKDRENPNELLNSLNKTYINIMNYYAFPEGDEIIFPCFNSSLLLSKVNEIKIIDEIENDKKIISEESYENNKNNKSDYHMYNVIIQKYIKSSKNKCKEEVKKLIVPNKVIYNNTIKKLLNLIDENISYIIEIFSVVMKENFLLKSIIHQKSLEEKDKFEKFNTFVISYIKSTDLSLLQSIINMLVNYNEELIKLSNSSNNNHVNYSNNRLAIAEKSILAFLLTNSNLISAIIFNFEQFKNGINNS